MLLIKTIEKLVSIAIKASKLFNIMYYLKSNRSFYFENNKKLYL